MKFLNTKYLITLILISMGFGSSLPSGVSIHKLNNGMDVILIENKSLPMVGANVVVKTGSAYETYATSGMSHMLEHLLFNGTTTRKQKELYDDGDRIGAYNNANTGEYYTNYMMVTPTEHIQSGMKIQADMLFNSILPEEKYDKEKGIVLEEIAQSLARPGTQIETDIQSILFDGHSLSLPTLGTYSTIESLPLPPVREYYEGNYVPNNMILSVIGHFDSEEMLEWVKDIYGKPGPGSVYRSQDADFNTGFETPKKNSTITFHRSHSDSTTIIHLAFELPEHPVSGFFDLMENILSEKMETLEAASKKKFGKSVQSIKGEIRKSPIRNYLIAKATLIASDQLDDLIHFLSNEIRSIKLNIKKDAISVFATSKKTSFYKSLEKPHMFGIYNAHIFAQKGIDGFLSSFDESLYGKAAETLKKFRIESEPTVIIHHPMDSKEKNESGTKSVILFDHDGSGTTLIAKQNASSPLLAVHYLMKHKSNLENEFGENAAKILHNCFGQRMKSEKIQKQIAPFGFTFTVNDNPWIPMDDIYLHDDFGYIRVEGLADDMDDAIGFLNNTFLNFTPTEEEFNKANAPSHGGYGGMSHKNIAKEKFNTLVDKYIYPKTLEQIELPQLTYESLLIFAGKYWAPENAIVSVVSPASPEDVNQLFSGFGSNEEKDTIIPNEKSYQLNSKSVTIDEDGGGAQSYLFWGFMKDVEPKDKPALTALSLILKDKIVFDIREKQGMAYRMHAGISLKKNKALFSINFGTRPENADVLIPQFPGFFSKNMLNDVDNATLEKSVNMYLGRMMFRRLSSINQAYYLGHSFYFDGDMNSDSEFLERLKSVTLDDLKYVAKKYMDAKNPISITVR
ncbi:MAG: insulinase family protein [Candidatus Marinimicrobia bacterium]|nr:insulinase family protein [Candidatus Neomarinimicrobiota bacterium]